ncbi:N-acetylglucosamine kinase [Microbacterium sp.]|uniref:N-acetylglucosamine kinase n=1 Tax=Microbacterium sp. TaxID=51671 RepID=UPI003F9BACCE
MSERRGCIAVDLGKTTIRLRGYGTARSLDATGSGAPGLADEGGVAAAAHSITAAITTWPAETVAGIASWSIGAAGAGSAPSASLALARQLRERLDAPITLTSDMVTAHAGAMQGRPGTLLIAGTGAVALRISDVGAVDRSDGWGPWLGDEGSGRWIGQCGLSAALRAIDGRGPHTALESDALTLCDGVPTALPQLMTGASAAARLGAFAPSVLARADEDDPVASAIVLDAARALADTAASVAPSDREVVLVGGLGEHDGLRLALDTALVERGLLLRSPRGDALDGAALLAEPAGLPHERLVIRA